MLISFLHPSSSLSVLSICLLTFTLSCPPTSMPPPSLLQLSQRAREIYNSFLSSKATTPVNIDSQAQLADDILNAPRPDMFKEQQLQVAHTPTRSTSTLYVNDTDIWPSSWGGSEKLSLKDKVIIAHKTESNRPLLKNDYHYSTECLYNVRSGIHFLCLASWMWIAS